MEWEEHIMVEYQILIHVHYQKRWTTWSMVSKNIKLKLLNVLRGLVSGTGSLVHVFFPIFIESVWSFPFWKHLRLLLTDLLLSDYLATCHNDIVSTPLSHFKSRADESGHLRHFKIDQNQFFLYFPYLYCL